MSQAGFLKRLVELLEGCAIPYMLVGSMASAEDTILAKLEWAAMSEPERQLRDVAGVVAVQGEALDRAYVERWAAELGVEALWRRALELADEL